MSSNDTNVSHHASCSSNLIHMNVINEENASVLCGMVCIVFFVRKIKIKWNSRCMEWSVLRLTFHSFEARLTPPRRWSTLSNQSQTARHTKRVKPTRDKNTKSVFDVHPSIYVTGYVRDAFVYVCVCEWWSMRLNITQLFTARNSTKF